MKPMSFDKIAFVATEMPEAQAALARLTAQYGATSPDEADIEALARRPEDSEN